MAEKEYYVYRYRNDDREYPQMKHAEWNAVSIEEGIPSNIFILPDPGVLKISAHNKTEAIREVLHLRHSKTSEPFILWDTQMKSHLGSYPTYEDAEKAADERFVPDWRKWIEIRNVNEKEVD